MFFLGLMAAGLIIGIISAFFGIGGGIVAVPAMYMVFPELPAQTVIGSSLGMICLNSILNTRNFYKIGRRCYSELLIILSVGMGIGVVLGSSVALMLPSQTLKLIFGIIVILLALKTGMTKTPTKSGTGTWEVELTLSLKTKTFLSAFGGGVISGVTGLGGGAVLVPLFISVLFMPFRWVPVYSNIAMVVGTGIGLLTYGLKTGVTLHPNLAIIQPYQWGHANGALILGLFSGAFITSRLGAKLSQIASPKTTKRLFILLMVVLGTRMIIR
jgi:uncharacterized membrane protein YfcA